MEFGKRHDTTDTDFLRGSRQLVTGKLV